MLADCRAALISLSGDVAPALGLGAGPEDFARARTALQGEDLVSQRLHYIAATLAIARGGATLQEVLISLHLDELREAFLAYVGAPRAQSGLEQAPFELF